MPKRAAASFVDEVCIFVSLAGVSMNSTTDPELIGKVSGLRSTHGTAVSFKLDSSASRSRSAGTTRVPIASMACMSFA